MKNLNEELLQAFSNSNRSKVKELIEAGADTKVLNDYAKKVGGKNLTLSQGWMLEDIYNNKI